MTQEQLLDYISKMIKNNQKHFKKDQASEEIYKNLKSCKHSPIY